MHFIYKAHIMRIFTASLLLLISMSSYAAQTITVGIVPQFSVKKLHGIWQPILDELHKETGYDFVFRGAPDIPTYEKEFLAGQFDLAYMNPYHYLVADKIYTPLVRDTGRQLYGIVVVPKDSEYTSLADLDGKMIALPAPNALGASLMTRAAMANDYKIDFYTKYVKTHSSVYLNVALGKAAAGGGVQKTFNQQPQRIKDRLRILYQTKKVSPHPVVINQKLPEEVGEKIRAAFIRIAATEEGRQLLSKIPMKKLGIAQPSDYDDVRALNLDPFYQRHN